MAGYDNFLPFPAITAAPMKPRAHTPLRLGLLLFPGCMPAGLFAVADMARAANLRAQASVIEVQWVGVDMHAVPTWQGPSLSPALPLARADMDALLVPGLWLASPDALPVQLERLSAVVQALRGLRRGVQVWSYCTGVAVAAAGGRLRGRRATATWWLRQPLSQQFPSVDWCFDEPLVADGPATTAAGASGYLPLMQQVFAQRLSQEAMADIQNLLMLPRPRTIHPAFLSHDLMAVDDADLRRAMLWIQRSPARTLRLALLAAAVGLSPRTLARRVALHAGTSAAQWMHRIKLRQVSEVLCDTSHPLKRIAEDLGFASESGLHRSFRKATGLTPAGYRAAYGR